jgi:hypothetical protein
VQVSDRTAAVKWSRCSITIGEKALTLKKALTSKKAMTGREGERGDETKSEDLPVERTYHFLRTKERYVPE